MKPVGTIAIVGRPNVGKSTLFNRLLEHRTAIMIDVPGTTRDRIYGTMELENRFYEVIDTGGLELLNNDDPIQSLIQIQVKIAVDEASLILFLVDGQSGVTPLDETVADYLRKSGKKVVLLVNKVDDYGNRALANDFYSLGCGEPHWMSSLHGLNIDVPLQAVINHFKDVEVEEDPEEEEKSYKLAIVGQPNVGKSSLLNRFLKTDRVMVDDVAGTTRDPIEAPFEMQGTRFTLIDTAGIRRVNQLKNHIDKISVIYSEKVIKKADLVLFVLDATRPLAQQDKRIAGTILEEQKPCIMLINKWDLVEDKEETVTKLEEQFVEELYFLKFCPRVYISALSGTRVPKLQDKIIEMVTRANLSVNTHHLNRLIQEASTIHQPPSYKGRQLKIYYVSQHKGRQGTFVFMVNDPGLIHFSYRRYLENTIRDYYKFEGIPLKLIFKGKKKEKKR
jgi:GTP-binding protein